MAKKASLKGEHLRHRLSRGLGHFSGSRGPYLDLTKPLLLYRSCGTVKGVRMLGLLHKVENHVRRRECNYNRFRKLFIKATGKKRNKPLADHVREMLVNKYRVTARVNRLQFRPVYVLRRPGGAELCAGNLNSVIWIHENKIAVPQCMPCRFEVRQRSDRLSAKSSSKYDAPEMRPHACA